MSIWTDASAAIDAVFVEDETILYTGAGAVAKPIPAIRSEHPAPDFTGRGATLKTIIYEIAFADLPARPSKSGDWFIHRGRKWSVINVDRSDEVSKWQLTASDAGEAP